MIGFSRRKCTVPHRSASNCARFEILFGKRIPLFVMHTAAWIALASFELLFISAIMQLGLALPMAYYFQRATVVVFPQIFSRAADGNPDAAASWPLLWFHFRDRSKNPSLITGITLEAITGTVHWSEHCAWQTRACPRQLWSQFFSPAQSSFSPCCSPPPHAAHRHWLSPARRQCILDCCHPIQASVQCRSSGSHRIDVGQGDSIFVVSPKPRF